MSARRFTAAVIGLGRIGQEYDYAVRGKSRVLTHAAAFWHHPRFDLVAAVDTALPARRRFNKKFKHPAYPSVSALFQKHPRLDVVALAVPTAKHRAVFDEVLQHRVRAVVCEKPLAASVRDGEHMVSEAKARRVPLLVNYMRRFEPGTLRVRQLLQEERLGTIFKGTAWYSKGFVNSASHLVDLLRFWLGDVSEITVLERGLDWPRARGRVARTRDPEPDARIRFGATPVYFFAAREEHFTYVSIELLGTRGKLRYAERGEVIEVRRAVRDPVFAGYMVLESPGRQLKSDMLRYQWHVVDHLYRHLTRGQPLYSDGASALRTLKAVEEVVRVRDTGL